MSDEKPSSRNKARYDRLKAQKLCTSCGKRPVDADCPSRCYECREKQKRTEKRWRTKGKTRPPVSISEEYHRKRYRPYFVVRWKGCAVRFPYRDKEDRLRAIAAALSFRLSVMHEYFPEAVHLKPKGRQSATLQKYFGK